MTRPLLVAGLLGLVLSFSACEGGCGESPSSGGSSDSNGQTVSGNTGGGGGGGDAAIPLGGARKRGEGDNPLAPPKAETQAISAAREAPGARVQAPAGTNTGPASVTTPQVDKLAAVQEVMPGDFERIVLRNPKPVLVLYLTSSCRPCAQVEFAMGKLAKDYDGKVSLTRMDLNRPGAYELLPAGLRRLPLPALAFYQDGSPLNIRQNIPVPPDSSSQLSAWLRRVIDGRDVRLN